MTMTERHNGIERRVSLSPLRHLSHVFGPAWERHCDRLHNADYEVCHDPLCWLSWQAEKWLWYHGQEW